MFNLLKLARNVSHFTGTAKAFLEHKNRESITSFTMWDPLSGAPCFHMPNARQIAEVMEAINSTGQLETLNLSRCILFGRAVEELARGLPSNSSIQSLTVQAEGLGGHIFHMFEGLANSKNIKYFEATGLYHCNNRPTLNISSVQVLANAVSYNRKLMNVRLDHIGIEAEHRNIILEPYEEKNIYRPLADIKIAGFVNGTELPEHPQVNDKHFVDREHLKPASGQSNQMKNR